MIEHLSDQVIDQALDALGVNGHGELIPIPVDLVTRELDSLENMYTCEIQYPSTSGGMQEGGTASPLTFVQETHSRSDFFNTDSYTDEFRINPPPDNVSPLIWIETAFFEVYTRMTEQVTPDTHRIIFKFGASGMEKPAYYNVRPGFSFDQQWTHVSSVCQSSRAYDAVICNAMIYSPLNTLYSKP